MTTILLIEDNFEIRENTAELLSLEGYQVIVAEDGLAGVNLALNAKPDLILCDVMMPGLNGYEVCEKLKQDPSTKKIPIIFVTAKFESSERKVGLKLGASAYLSKPYEFEDLVGTISKCLNH